MHTRHEGGNGHRGVIATGLTWILYGLLAREAGAATWYTDQKATAGTKDGKSWTNATLTVAAGLGKLSPGDTLLVRGDAIYTNETFSNISLARSGRSPAQPTIVQGVPGEGAGQLPIIWGGALREGAGYANDVPAYPNVWSCYHTSGITYDILEAYPAGTYFPNIYSNHSAGIKYTKKTTLSAVNSTPGSWMEDTGTAKKLYVRPHADPMADWDIVHGKIQMWQPSGAVSNVMIAGFIMKQAREYTVRLYNAGNHNITFSGNTFVKRGILTEYGGMTGVVVCANTFINCGMAFPNVTNCSFFANTVSQPLAGWKGTGISVSGGSNAIFDNLCYSNTTGIALDASKNAPPTSTTIFNNKCFGNTTGIYVGYTKYTAEGCSTVFNNTCHDNTSYNMQIQGGTNCAVFNNTLYNAGTYSLYLTKASQNLKVFNNLSWERGSGDYAVYADTAADDAYSGDYNDYFATDGATFGYFGGANKADLGAWRTATGQDANSLSADPGVTSTGTVSVLPDLRLIRRSPCRDAGTASFLSVSAPAFDGEGDARPFDGHYDIGSDEMTIPAPGIVILVL